MENERITGVAILSEEGDFIALPAPKRHIHIYAIAAFMNIDMEPDKTQGFVTNTGRFVDRKEAKLIAIEADQLTENCGKSEKLYSEDLW